MIRIVPRISREQINAALSKKAKVIEEAMISRLQFVGENFVRNTRLNGSYKDHTGNLRNSTGYIILKDGVQLFENFDGKAELGRAKGKAVATELIENFPQGLVIIGVAGMEYAAAVESKGYDVITSSSLTAETELKNAISKLSDKVGRIQ
jgi:hypothetical protein